VTTSFALTATDYCQPAGFDAVLRSPKRLYRVSGGR
jgi:hypothetical protein